jgi:hypothetical protein
VENTERENELPTLITEGHARRRGGGTFWPRIQPKGKLQVLAWATSIRSGAPFGIKLAIPFAVRDPEIGLA